MAEEQPATDPILERLKQSLGDRYEILKELGRGGMATVYLARDIKHDREVAIKVLLPELSATIGADRFEREIKVAAKLQHPNILSLFDSGVADGLLFYVMPFVKGESLRDRLDREGQLPVENAIQLTLEVADALGFAHEQHIVHRDVKPENVMISNGHALMADFGIARAVEEGGAAKLTQTGMAVGTPVYMAPEQAVGEKVGPAADIYSLGCMLYEMLAGEPPFTGKNATQIMARHAMEQVPSVRIVRPAVPEEVEEAIFAALGKSPADRPQTCAQFAEILGMPLGATATLRAMGRTTSRRTPTGTTRAHRTMTLEAPPVPVWRKPWAIALMAVVVLGGGFSAFWFGFRNRGPAVEVGGLDPHNVAVLYFDDTSTDRSLGFLADGISEALIQRLGQVQGLSVRTRNAVDPWRDATVGADSVGRALNAGTIVRGAVEKLSDKVRVSIRLVDGNSGVDLMRASVEQPLASVFGVRDSVAEEVARLIRGRLGEEIKLREQRMSTSSIEVWSLVQRAEKLRRSGETAGTRDTAAMGRDLRAADSLLALAERIDGKWADPPALRALVAYNRSRLSGRDQVLIKQWVGVGLGHADRALALDANHADALETRGNLKYWAYLMGLEADATRAQALLTSAREDLEAATRANPAQAGAWASLSHLYNQTGSGVDVNLAARRALEADAFLANADQVLNRLFLSSYDLGNFPDATNACAEMVRRFPESFQSPRCRLYLLTTRAEEPDVVRAWQLADSVKAMVPENRKAYFELNSNLLVAAVLARAGQKDSALAVTGRSIGTAEISPTRDLSLFAAFVYLQAGEKDKAIDQLKIYFAANDRMRKVYAEQPGWWFQGIAEDPAFRQLVGR